MTSSMGSPAMSVTPAPREVGQGAEQVGAYVGVDPVAGERVGDAPFGEVAGRERGDGVGRERDERFAECVAVARSLRPAVVLGADAVDGPRPVVHDDSIPKPQRGRGGQLERLVPEERGVDEVRPALAVGVGPGARVPGRRRRARCRDDRGTRRRLAALPARPLGCRDPRWVGTLPSCSRWSIRGGCRRWRARWSVRRGSGRGRCRRRGAGRCRSSRARRAA